MPPSALLKISRNGEDHGQAETESAVRLHEPSYSLAGHGASHLVQGISVNQEVSAAIIFSSAEQAGIVVDVVDELHILNS